MFNDKKEVLGGHDVSCLRKLVYCGPPFWGVTMADIYGPFDVYVPGHEQSTRNKRVLEAKVYVLTFVCPTTRSVNLQVIETKSAEGMVDGLTRLTCEVGMPYHLLIDQDS